MSPESAIGRCATSVSPTHRSIPRPNSAVRARRTSPSTRISDVLANHWVIDGNLITGQNKIAGPMVAREMLRLARQRLTGRPEGSAGIQVE